MNKLASIVLGAVALTLALSLAACGGEGSAAGPSPSPSPSAAPTATPEASPTPKKASPSPKATAAPTPTTAPTAAPADTPEPQATQEEAPDPTSLPRLPRLQPRNQLRSPPPSRPLTPMPISAGTSTPSMPFSATPTAVNTAPAAWVTVRMVYYTTAASPYTPTVQTAWKLFRTWAKPWYSALPRFSLRFCL